MTARIQTVCLEPGRTTGGEGCIREGRWAWRVRRTAAVVCACLGWLSACGGNGPGDVRPWTPPVSAMAHDLTRDNPAGAGTTVVIRVERGASVGDTAVHFRFDDGQVLRQCIPGTETRVLAARLVSADGTTAWQHRRGDACPPPTDVAAGRYTLVLTHAAAPDGMLLFVQQPANRPTSPAPGVSLKAGAVPDTEPGEYLLLRQGHSWLFANPASASAADQRVVQVSSGRWTSDALWSLSTQTVNGRHHQRLVLKGQSLQDGTAWVLCPRSGMGNALVQASQCDPANGDFPATDGLLTMGSHQAMYCYGPGGGLVQNTACWSQWGDLGMQFLNRTLVDPSQGLISLNPRYRVDASAYEPQQGEVVVYTDQLEGAGNGRPALVFNADAPLRLSYVRGFHIRTGPNTSVSFVDGQWVTGDTEVTFRWDTTPPTDLRISTSLDVLLQSNACRGCDLSGLDLSGIAFDHVDLRDARLRGVRAVGTSFLGAQLANADFSNANLTGAIFERSSLNEVQLNGTIFDGADLSQASFDQAPLGCVSMRDAVLTGTRFTAAKLQCVDFSGSAVNQALFEGVALPGENLPLIAAHTDGQCGAQRHAGQPPAMPSAGTGLFADVPCRGLRLAGAQVWVDAPPVALWKGTDLSDAVVQGPAGQTLREAPLAGTDFSGGRYRGLRFSGADLRGANFSDADLAGAQLDGALLGPLKLKSDEWVYARFQRARLRGANLSFANATSADFSAATLSADPSAAPDQPESRAASAVRLFAPKVNFTNADLTGADFTEAQLYGPGAQLKAVAVRTRFNAATLSYADLGGARLQGADFSNANLVNATLAGAQLGQAANGTPTTFTGAQLHGLNMAGLDAGPSAFAGATVATTEGSMQVARERAPGDTVSWIIRFCPTQLPLTGPATTCTSGGSGPCASWVIDRPRQPTCVPSEEQPCARDHSALQTLPFTDLGATGLACVP